MATLYQQLILEHYRNPRNYGSLTRANRQGEGINPICGDTVHLELDVQGDVIARVAFTGQGCAMCMGSASLMTEALQGVPVVEAKALGEAFEAMLREGGVNDIVPTSLEPLEAVRDYPTRVKCVLLPWGALLAALQGSDDVATTE